MSAQLFFGLWLLPLGILVIRSVFMQKSLGVMLIIDCLAILIWFVQFFWFTEVSIIADICLLTSLVAEVWLTLWLLIKGFGRTKEYPSPSSESLKDKSYLVSDDLPN